MNKLTKQEIDLIKKTIDIAEANDIVDVRFAAGKIGGYSAENGVFILEDCQNSFSFPTLALSRLGVLKKRLSLVDNLSEYDLMYESNSKNVTKLIFKGKRTKLEFRCTDPDSLGKMPVKISDPIYFSFEMDDDTITVLSRVSMAMDTKTIALIGDKNERGLILRVEDENRDVLEHETESEVRWSDVCDVQQFNFVYSARKIARLIREAVQANFKTVNITKRGFMITQSKGITVYTVPEV